MILTVEQAKAAVPELAERTDNEVSALLDALEILVRKYTNNNFQNRDVRFTAASEGSTLTGTPTDYFSVGDTIQISQSAVNDGLYVVIAVTDDTVTVDGDLFAVEKNLVTKVEYPPAVKQGVVNLLSWEATQRDKVGIQSETLSRHSVTYADMTGANQTLGYPISLMGFLDLYKKARF